MSGQFTEAAGCLPEKLRLMLSGVSDEIKKSTWEIRLRIGSPVILCGADGIGFVGATGRVSRLSTGGLPLMTSHELEVTFSRLCDYSVHSHESDIRCGFLTLDGGHRAGICGTAVLESGHVTGIRNVSSICIRIARENRCAAERLCRELFCGEASESGIIIAGAPSTGKTTVLRDLARRLSGGECGRIRKTVVVDERGELAAVRRGVPSYNMGLCCDVYTGYPKAEAINCAVRTMSPEYIICDELAGNDELLAVAQGFNSGVIFAVSVHASSKEDLLSRHTSKELICSPAFGHVVLLRTGGVCEIEKIYETDELKNEICGGFLGSDGMFNGRNENVCKDSGACKIA